ncbi:MAG: gamma-glutamylcyclotransferase [Methylobacterium sp.]|nr:MAG: gamma-glutamylcyclotransferase [Methylobacterium sp.]
MKGRTFGKGERPKVVIREDKAANALTAIDDDESALQVMTDEELKPGLDAIIEQRGGAGDLWVFAYGSLMWRPEFAFAESRIGTVRGFHRRFCLLQRRFRGTPERPGFVLALDRGGSCRGVAFRLAGTNLRETLMPVWRREMRGRGYVARWLPVATEADVADRIAVACGHLGPSAEYLFRTVEACEALGIRDRHLWNLQALVAARLDLGHPISGGAPG